MCASSRAFVVACLAGTVSPAFAADAGRADLLAAEAARFTAVPGAEGAGSWWALGLLLAGTMVAAFAGTVVASRRKVRVGGDHREVTFRLRKEEPLRLKTDTLGRLSEVLDDLENIGADLKRRPAGDGPPESQVGEMAQVIRDHAADPPVAPPASSSAAPRPHRGDRRSAYDRARALLAEGRDSATVRELTGLKAAEIDLLGAAPPAAAHPIRRERPALNVGPPRPVFRRVESP